MQWIILNIPVTICQFLPPSVSLFTYLWTPSIALKEEQNLGVFWKQISKENILGSRESKLHSSRENYFFYFFFFLK